MGINSRHIIDFSTLHRFDLDEIGRNAYQLGELKYLNIPIPDGFVILPNIPRDSITELHNSYRRLSGLFKETSLNIFTSPLKGKSLQFLDIKGDANFVLTIKEIWATQIKNPTAIVVQKNIKSKIKGILSPESDIAKKIRKHFYFSQEINYVIEKGKIYIVTLKHLTKIPEQKPVLHSKRQQKILAKGIPVNPGIVTGSVKILRNQDYYRVKSSEIAVVPQLNKLLYSKIAKAKAVIADSILTSSYDKMIYRNKIKNPTIMGAKNALNVLRNGNIVTVNGLTGVIYSGGII